MNPGTRLGPYEILEPLGAGGMGEVWLAQDTRLGRKVAVKVLPAEFAADPERLARFEQEARASAALNHPHIAAVFDVGAETVDGATTHFMVQEYLQGHTLRDTLDGANLPLPKALALGSEIASALAAAHKAGIVHRDLKPENIFVTEDGHAKVLDFGLAKLTEMAAAPMGSQSMSPTVLGTQAGSIMGTAGYMAPEQVTGENVDHRADLFAFGCVLYELVFAERAFSGRNVMQTLDLILAEQPRRLEDWPAQQPWPLRWILGRCLDKNPERRCQSAADLGADLGRLREEIAAGAPLATASGAESGATTPPGGLSPVARGALVAAAVLAAALGGAAIASRWAPAPDPAVAVAIPIDGNYMNVGNRNFAISPDGQQLAYVGGEDGRLVIRRLSSFEATTIPDTAGAESPFFSPDGQWVAYFANGQIYKVLLSGSAPQLVAEAPERARGAAWTDDGVLLIGSGVQTGGIFAVAATGAAELRRVRSPLPDGAEVSGSGLDLGVLSLERPVALPGSDWLLATREAFNDQTMIVAISRDGEQLREVIPGWDARYADGHLYVADDVGGIVAVRFDPVAAELRGTPFALPQRIATRAVGAALYDVAANGTLLFLPADSGQIAATSSFRGLGQLVWTDMAGMSRTWPTGAEGNFSEIELSPDGRLALITETDEENLNRILVTDLERGVRSELPLGDLRMANSAIWSPDGRSAIFSGTRPGQSVSSAILRQSIGADPGTEPELLHTEGAVISPGSLTPDGEVLTVTSCVADCAIYFLSLDESGASPLPYDDIPGMGPAFSPDGALLAYIAQEGDRPEAFVRPFPGPGGRVRVSRDGAAKVVWAPDGRTLYYSTIVNREAAAAESSVMVATIEREPTLRVSEDRELFESSGLRRRFFPFTSGPELIDFDLDPRGDRFLALSPTRSVGEQPDAPDDAPEISLRLITRWSDAIRRLAPEGR